MERDSIKKSSYLNYSKYDAFTLPLIGTAARISNLAQSECVFLKEYTRSDL
jgi:hypothetical protein